MNYFVDEEIEMNNEYCEIFLELLIKIIKSGILEKQLIGFDLVHLMLSKKRISSKLHSIF